MSPERMGGTGAVLAMEMERARAAGSASRTVVLVEGVSDQRAIETLARRRGRELGGEGVDIVPTAGATNIGRFLDLLGPGGYDVPLAGLCDEGEAPDFRSALEHAGLGVHLSRADMEGLGFYVCVRDLEEELIRALGADVMEGLIAEQGQLRRFRSFQNQPAQRHKTIERQLWRWLGNHKIRYAPLMVEALDLGEVPPPLEGVLASI
ncbi:MAG: TOPRIM nucleotidyl transferase/hydrolase domain-containing protein [Acidimicrobiia bacterium]